MDFSLNNTAVYKYFVGISAFYRYGLTFFLLGLLTYGWLIGVYSRIDNVIVSRQQEITLLQKKYRDFERSKVVCKELDAKIYDLKNKLRAAAKGKPAQEVLQTTIQMILQQTSLCHLALNAYSFDSEVDKGWCKKNKMVLDVEGEVAQLFCFLKHLRLSEDLLAVRKIDLSHLQGSRFNLKCAITCMAVKPSSFS